MKVSSIEPDGTIFHNNMTKLRPRHNLYYGSMENWGFFLTNIISYKNNPV